MIVNVMKVGNDERSTKNAGNRGCPRSAKKRQDVDMKKILVVVLLLVMLAPLFSATIGKIGNFKGKVDVKISGKWTPAKRGMLLDGSYKIRVSKNSYVNIRLKNESTRLQQGIYTVDDLETVQNPMSRLNRLKIKLGKGSYKKGVTAVAGVRGSDVSEQVADIDRFPISPSDLIWEE